MKQREQISTTESQDNWTRTILQSAEVPAVTFAQAESLSRALGHRKPKWVAPSGFAAVASAGLIVSFVLLRPVPSVALTLNQVDQAQLSAPSFSVVHRIGSLDAGAYSVTESRDGNRWKISYGVSGKPPFGETIMDGSRTMIVDNVRRRTPGGAKQPVMVLIDGPTKAPRRLRELPTTENFLTTPSEIFRIAKGPVTVSKGVTWKGRMVDRFENVSEIHPAASIPSGVKVSAEYAEKRSRPIRVRHVLYADPGTHRPLEIESSYPDAKNSIVETFTYDYTPLSDAAFKPALPSNAKIIDMRVERQAVHSAVGRDGLVVVDDWGAGVFLPDRPDIKAAARNHHVRVRINGGPNSYTWTQPVTISAEGIPDGKSYWRQMLLYVAPPVANMKLLNSAKSVKVTVNGKRFTMPVRHVANSRMEFDPHDLDGG